MDRSANARHDDDLQLIKRETIRFCSQGKLDSYKKLVDGGVTLNEDQKVRLLEKNSS